MLVPGLPPDLYTADQHPDAQRRLHHGRFRSARGEANSRGGLAGSDGRSSTSTFARRRICGAGPNCRPAGTAADQTAMTIAAAPSTQNTPTQKAAIATAGIAVQHGINAARVQNGPK